LLFRVKIMFSSATRANAPLAPASQIFPNVLASSGGSSPPSRPYRPLHPGVADFEARKLFGIGIGLATAPQ
jgi:hypothetical protein